MARSGEPTTSEQRIAAVQRQRDALELRKAGVDFRTIADRLGYEGPSGAHKAVKSALKAMIKEPAEELIQLELARLDKMLFAVWTRATNAKGADLGAIDRALKIMARRAEYLGLDAPKEVKVAHELTALADRVAADLGLNAADVLAEAERIVAAVGSTD